MSEMQLLAVCVLMAAAAVPSSLATPDLFCNCRVRRYDWTFVLNCDKQQQNGASTISCKKANVLEIPHGYVYIPGYALVKLYGIFMKWSAAKKFCEDEGARLAIPRDHNAYEGLKKMFQTEKGEKRVWWAYLGITDQAKEGTFVGVDGLPVSYVQWGQNEPNNYAGIENCVDFADYGWANDANCENAAPFFCERRLSVTVPASYAWSQLAGRFYKVHKEEKAHAEAAQVCRSENATLAVPDTWQRVQVLQSLLELNSDYYLTGFTDQAVEGDFVTETGRHLKDMEYQFWNSGEPNNNDHRGKPENCVGLSTKGYLNDVACDKKIPFICEIAPI